MQDIDDFPSETDRQIDVIPDRKKSTESKAAHVVITRPSEDLNRYLVDKFNPSTKQAKQTLFESIDITAYKASAKCVSLCTSESRLPLRIRVFATRYYEILNGDTGYRVTWNELNGSNSPSKCLKIVIHLFATDESSEDQLVAITIFVSTGRFLIQGKLSEKWSLNEFLILLYTINSIQSVDMLDTSKDKFLFASPMSKFFKKLYLFRLR